MSSGFIELQGAVPLPFVLEKDPSVVEKLAGFTGCVVDFGLPAVGIVGDPNQVLDAHKRHRELVHEALQQTEPKVDYVDRTIVPETFLEDPEISPHMDSNGVPSDFNDDGHMTMRLALHTGLSDADVFVADGFVVPKHIHMGEDTRGFEERLTNDAADLHLGHQHGILQALSRNALQNAVTGDLYRFLEAHGSSILFRYSSSVGPVTAHYFRRSNPDEDRNYRVSDFNIQSWST